MVSIRRFSELGEVWPARWDECVHPVLWWLHRTTSDDPRLTRRRPTPSRLLFGRDVRTQIGAISPELDDNDLVDTGPHNLITDTYGNWRAVLQSEAYQKALHAIRDQQRTRIKDTIVRPSAAVKAKKGNLALTRESDSALGNKGIHQKPVREKWTGP